MLTRACRLGRPQVDHQMRGLPVQRIALRNQPLDAGARIIGAQQGTAAVTFEPLPQLRHRRLQIHYKAQLPHTGPAFRRQYRAAAGGQHTTHGLGQLSNQGRLPSAKTRLAFELENSADRHAAPRLQHGICIDKWTPERRRQAPTNGRFT